VQALPYGDQHFRDIAGKFRCPTCTGLSVLDSDAAFSVQIKQQVVELMKQGKSDKEIVDFFTERYGPWILREPPKSGFSVIAWALPIGFLVFGPILIWALAWRRKQTVPTFGVRAAELIATEMQRELTDLRTRRS
jgi:cytochrome c-type biogenesis protein CcmH